MQMCGTPREEEHDLAYVEHPSQIVIGSGNFAIYTGAIVCNTATCLILLALAVVTFYAFEIAFQALGCLHSCSFTNL